MYAFKVELTALDWCEVYPESMNSVFSWEPFNIHRNPHSVRSIQLSDHFTQNTRDLYGAKRQM